MIKARIVGREKILNPSCPPHSDEGLFALNGIYCSPFVEFDDNTDESDICNTLKKKYFKENEHPFVNSIEIQYEAEGNENG